ncbi:hypothetical protein BDV11DRAFT_188566 [Aspergillus similis]
MAITSGHISGPWSPKGKMADYPAWLLRVCAGLHLAPCSIGGSIPTFTMTHISFMSLVAVERKFAVFTSILRERQFSASA